MNAEILDVVIIGAGLSGIGAAVHLTRECPGKRYAVLESRAAMGGTWDLFRYPGIRSDSDMFTLGYNFKPWTNPKAIADGPSIREYIREAAVEHGIDQHIRYQHQVLAVDWSSQEALWTVTARRGDTGETVRIASRFIICCAGYYKYEHGFTPEFAGRDDFEGTIIHPQHWPESFDWTGKRVVVIGSGATAVTLVPALSLAAEKVTMLQRSPGYVVSLPQQDQLINGMMKWLPATLVYAFARARNVLLQMGIFSFTRKFPQFSRKLLIGQVAKQVGPDVDIQHFTPRYNVWDERVCAVPDGDLFKAVREQRAGIETGHIDRFTRDGILLKSGRVLEADAIVTATGLEVQILGGMQLSVDGKPVSIADRLYYKGCMLEGVPNLATVFGYTNASWTLKADLIAQYVTRLMRHMDKHGYAHCAPMQTGDREVTEPILNLTAGYIQRALAQLPRQGAKEPWKMYQNYFRDYAMLRRGKVDDGVLRFSRRVAAISPEVVHGRRVATSELGRAEAGG